VTGRVKDGAPKPTSLTGKILVGLAGWSYPDWAGIVYPAHHSREFDEASYLADYFDVIEINTSFYQALRPGVAARWVERLAAHPRFLFTAKLWQRFTHETGATAADEQAVRDGFAPLLAAGKLAAVLLQFPYSFHRTPENVARLKQLLDRFQDYQLVVEIRHSSWNDAGLYELLKEHHASFCNIDQPVIGRSIAPSQRATAPIGYIRLHGRRYDTWFSDDPATPPEERYNYLYSETELAPWAERIRKLARHTRTTFVIANNHFEGKAVVNALQLIHLLTAAKVRVPEPLRHRYPELEAIADAPAKEPTLFPDLPR
jgi:uncharacterized protein YecE (DUF72 family)